MPYPEWKSRHQTDADTEKQIAFDAAFAANVGEKR